MAKRLSFIGLILSLVLTSSATVIPTAFSAESMSAPTAAPSGLTASASGTTVMLGWADNSTDETHFKIYRKPPGGSWAQLDMTIAGATSYTNTGTVENSTYEYHVNACNDHGCSADSNIATATTGTSAPAPTIPATPTGLATTVSGTTVSLGWVDVATNETEYKVSRRPSGTSSWTMLTSIGVNSSAYTDYSLANGSYEYIVRACNSNGCSSDSNTASATVASTSTPPPSGVPAAPSSLFIGGSSPTSISIYWADNSTDETEFKIERRFNSGSWSQVGSVVGNTTTKATTNVNTFYTDNNITGAGAYDYRIAACNSTGCSGYSSTTSQVIDATAPVAPSGLTATYSSTAGSVVISWTDNSTGEWGFRLNRRVQGSISWLGLASVFNNSTGNSVSYNDTYQLAANTTYEYVVRSYNTYESADSNIVTVSTGAVTSGDTTPPSVPGGVTATALSSSSIQISWSASTDNFGVSVYRIYRSGTEIGWVSSPTLSYTNTGLSPSTNYSYTVAAQDTSNNLSAKSSQVSATTLAGDGGSTFTVPAAPSNLTASVSPTTGTVQLNWTNNATNATEIKVYRRLSGGSAVNADTFSSGLNSYTSAALAAGTYEFYLTACNSSGCSGTLNTASVTVTGAGTQPTPSGVPASPSGLTAVKVAETVLLSWNDIATNETEYKVYQRDIPTAGPATGWFQIGNTLPAGTTSFVDTFIYAGSFEYRVQACNSSGCSYDSNIASITITGAQPPGSGAPQAPTGLAATLTGISITLKWIDNSTNENEFRIFQRDLPSTTWFQIGNISAGAISFVDSIVYDGTFEYRVIACNSSGCSADSNIAKITVGTQTTPGGAPSAPSGLTATYQRDGGSVALSWNDTSTNELEFRIYQRDSGTAWFQIGKNPAGLIGFLDVFVYQGTVEYRVLACNESGCSTDSNIASLTIQGETPAPGAVPAAPTNLVAKQNGNTIVLSWTDASTNETGFKVLERDPPNTNWFQIGSLLPTGASSFVDNFIYIGTFEYHVNACNSLGCSADSNIARVTVTSVEPGDGALAAPTNLRAAVSERKVMLTWTDNATNETGNKIWSRSIGGPAELTATTSPQISSYALQAPGPGTREYYITACNASGCSATSNTVVVVITDGTPTPGELVITSIFPSSGAIRTLVTIYGSGFATSGNTVKFDSGVIIDVPSSDTRTISFRAPEDRVPLCAVIEPRCLLPAPYNPVVPGTYNVSVTNASGTSNAVSFTVTAGVPPPGTPFVVDPSLTYPKDGATELETTTRIRVKLNREFDPTSTIKQFFSLAPEGAPTKFINGFFTMSQDSFEFAPSVGLEPDIAYTYKVLTTLKDRGGASLQSEFRATFKTKLNSTTGGAVVSGTVQDATGLNIAGAVLYIYKEGFGTYFQTSTDAEGKFQLNIPAGSYKLEVSQPHGRNDLIRPPALSLTVENGETKKLTLKFRTSAKQITGSVTFSDGKIITDAEIGAYSLETGQWTSARTDQSGRYALRVGGGKWKVGIRPLTSSANWSYDGPFPEVDFARDATDDLKTVNFIVPVSNTTLTVNAVDENKQALKDVGVIVDTFAAGDEKTSSGRQATQYRVTDATGAVKFSLQAGTYFIRVYLPQDRGYLNPQEQTIALRGGENKEITALFKRQTGATTVLLQGVTKLENGGVIDAFVWAWSEGGRFMHTEADKSGIFELRLASGDRWHVGAGKESDGFPYKTSEIIVDTAKTPAPLELILVKIKETRLAPSVEVSHAATEQVVVQTQDGAKATLPPGAAASHGNVNVKMDPVIEAASQASAKVIGTVYDVTVKDADGKEVKTLKDEVEIVLPYDEKELKAQGISEDDLAPSFVDEKTGAWVKINNFTIDKEKNVVICRVDHLTRFGLTANADATPPSEPASVAATLVDGKVQLTWKNPSADFDHARIYRSERAGELGKVVAAEVRENKFQDARVIPGTTYYYIVRSVDAADNESANTAQARVTFDSSVQSKPKAAKKTVLLRRNLNLGHKGEDVRALQNLLVREGVLASKNVTGRFDKITRQAVAKFQEKYAGELLKPFKLKKGTGAVGASTRKKINALLSK